MADAPRTLRVFIASPGDVFRERRAARRVIEELGASRELRERAQLVPVAWDNGDGGVPLIALQSPQKAIEQGLTLPSRCDIVLVIFYSRMGTPLSDEYRKTDGQPYLSGTEWEYEDAIRGTDEGRRPVVLLYRCTMRVCFVPTEKGFNESFAQFTAVKQFFDRCVGKRGEIVSAVNLYDDHHDFEKSFRSHLAQVVKRIIDPTERAVRHNKLPSEMRMVGRLDYVKRVVAGLRGNQPIVSIEGFPGLGKTNLASEIASLLAGRYKMPAKVQAPDFDFVVWLSAKDKPDKALWLNEVLSEIAETVGFVSLAQQTDLERKKAEVLEVLRKHRVLTIIDNFETIRDAELVDWLSQVPPASKVLATTRIPLPGSFVIKLDGLLGSSAVEFIRTIARGLGLNKFESMDGKVLSGLIEVTGGNPAALRLALGQLAAYKSLDAIVARLREHGDVFASLYEDSWNLISADARKVLRAVPLFTRAESISRPGLAAVSGLSDSSFDAAIRQLIDFKLLEFDLLTGRYGVPPLTRGYAADRLSESPEFEGAARTRWCDYFLHFIKTNAQRQRPSGRYWNALVTRTMGNIDSEWLSVREVIKWVHQRGDHGLVLDMVMLLVHYMDSRFYHADRVEFVNMAIAAANQLGLHEEEALLRIDALTWTYLEESKPGAAEEIERGMQIVSERVVDPQSRNDLTALALTWKARLHMENEQLPQALQRIEEARAIDCSPVVKYRVHLCAGDIQFRQDRATEALSEYHAAIRCSDTYGGEGGGYQSLPRIGLALAAVNDLEGAAEKFEQLAGLGVTTAKLYARYGQAVIASKRRNPRRALELAQSARAELLRWTSTNVLLRLIDKLFNEAQSANLRQKHRSRRRFDGPPDADSDAPAHRRGSRSAVR